MAFQDDEMNDFEQKLLQNGFSAKDIRKLNEILNRDDNKADTLQTLIQELSKRFWAGIISMLIILSVFIYGIAKGHKESLISYAIVLIIGAIIVYFVIPMNLAWKAHRFASNSKS
jgi:membrane protein YdbS with pleckstrin-like domain